MHLNLKPNPLLSGLVNKVFAMNLVKFIDDLMRRRSDGFDHFSAENKNDFVSSTFNLIKYAAVKSVGIRSPRSKKWLRDQIKGLETMPPELAEEYNLIYYMPNPAYNGLLPPYAFTLASLREWESMGCDDKPADFKRHITQQVITLLNIFGLHVSGDENGLAADYLQLISDQAGLDFDASRIWLDYYAAINQSAFNPYAEAAQITRFLDGGFSSKNDKCKG